MSASVTHLIAARRQAGGVAATKALPAVRRKTATVDLNCIVTEGVVIGFKGYIVVGKREAATKVLGLTRARDVIRKKYRNQSGSK
jgi:hypothetical protein